MGVIFKELKIINKVLRLELSDDSELVSEAVKDGFIANDTAFVKIFSGEYFLCVFIFYFIYLL